MKRLILIICMLLVMAITIDAQQSDFPKLTGPFLGQKPPGLVPEVFAPGVLSQFSMLHGKIVFSPNGLEVFWTCNAAPNAYDSLGEAYMNAGDKERAIENYEKSLKLNPNNASGMANLKKLRGE